MDRVRAGIARAACDRSRRRKKRDSLRPAYSTRRRLSTRATSSGRPTRGTSPICRLARKRSRTSRRTGWRRRARSPVSFLANTNAGSVSWSPDGAYLTFATSQRTEPGDVIRVDLPAADAEVPRGSVPRSVQGRAAEDAVRSVVAAGHTCRTNRPRGAGRTRPTRRDDPRGQAGRNRLRRHPPARERVAGGRRRRTAGDQPRWQMAAADGERRGPAEPVRIFDRRAVEGTGGGAAADVDAGREAQRAFHAGQQRGRTTSIAVACSTSRSSGVSRRRLP